MFNNVFPKIVSFVRQCEKNIVDRGRPQMTIWRMRVACWIPRATNAYSQSYCMLDT